MESGLHHTTTLCLFLSSCSFEWGFQWLQRGSAGGGRGVVRRVGFRSPIPMSLTLYRKISKIIMLCAMSLPLRDALSMKINSPIVLYLGLR
ncbi:hypothetical protein K458DRAFT_146401 [Lentithecium fluviatile CBS 122367]|uniref:Uncharacterized protein n=1 Tax=Lentithecium fluviatile CBS 122367 TaxID=1168545 RepID=A0A6G1JDK2_9PLEO|nr:hypothetical protein K458DRAFT_146401 [Lentithecium fluviatile CBS 122367]